MVALLGLLIQFFYILVEKIDLSVDSLVGQFDIANLSDDLLLLHALLRYHVVVDGELVRRCLQVS